MKYCNAVSLIFGAGITLFLCLFCSAFTPHSIYMWGGIAAIVMAIFAASFVNVPTQHAAVLKILGKRWDIIFYEGWCWIPWFLASAEIVDLKEGVVDVPLIKVFTKNNIEVGVDIWVYWKVGNPLAFLNLKNPQETIKTSTMSKSNEAVSDFVRANTDKQCLDQQENLQREIREKMSAEEEKLGVEILDIDIRPILPVEEIRKEYTEDKKKELRTKRYAKDLKRIKEEAPNLTDSEAANTTQVVEGIVKKEITEKKNTFKLDVESDVLSLITEFLPKKKTEKGDKK